MLCKYFLVDIFVMTKLNFAK